MLCRVTLDLDLSLQSSSWIFPALQELSSNAEGLTRKCHDGRNETLSRILREGSQDETLSWAGPDTERNMDFLPASESLYFEGCAVDKIHDSQREDFSGSCEQFFPAIFAVIE